MCTSFHWSSGVHCCIVLQSGHASRLSRMIRRPSTFTLDHPVNAPAHFLVWNIPLRRFCLGLTGGIFLLWLNYPFHWSTQCLGTEFGWTSNAFIWHVWNPDRRTVPLCFFCSTKTSLHCFFADLHVSSFLCILRTNYNLFNTYLTYINVSSRLVLSSKSSKIKDTIMFTWSL